MVFVTVKVVERQVGPRFQRMRVLMRLRLQSMIRMIT